MTIEDPWHWLRDPKYPQVDDTRVLDYLKAENGYFEAWKAQHQELVDQLFAEMKGRVKEDESSVPIRDGDWLYWWAFKSGEQYRTWYRKPSAAAMSRSSSMNQSKPRAANIFVSGHSKSVRMGSFSRHLPIMTARSGSSFASATSRPARTSRRSRRSGLACPFGRATAAGIVFCEVNDSWRSYRARYHRLGRPSEEDVTLYEETEELGFTVGVGKSHDRSTLFVSTGDNATTEVRFVSADDPSLPLTLISPRQPNREYHVDAAHGKLWIHTNDDHVNFRLASADPAKPDVWETVIPGSDKTYLTGVTAYRDHLAISSRIEGLDQLMLRTYSGEETRIPFKEASYSAFVHGQSRVRPRSRTGSAIHPWSRRPRSMTIIPLATSSRF